MIRAKRINNMIVTPPPSLDKKDPRPVRGRELFEEPYANVFIASRKKSGKTYTIYNILKKCVGKNTTVIFFCSTLYKDPVYKSIMAMLDKNKINYIGYTSLVEDGIDHLQELVECLTKEAEHQFMEDQMPKDKLRKMLFGDDEDDEKKPRKLKYLAPDYIMVLDDLSDELKSRSLVTLLKKNRHFLCKILISTQNWNDILPESRKQIDYVLVFKNMVEKKLIEIYRDCNVAITFEQFKKIYDWATQPAYSFMYVDCMNDTFRRNFNIAIEL